MNHDLELISRWAHDWRMSFNPDPQKQAVELLLSKKRHEIDHPVILFNNTPVQKVTEHKHLCIILDSKLSFSAHIKSAISKTRRGIGLLKYLSKYLPRRTLNELYKLYVRPHLDYGDVIYHIPAKVCEFSQNIVLPNLMEKIESVQYSAALAVTGTWRGTSRAKLYAELGWESLSSRSLAELNRLLQEERSRNSILMEENYSLKLKLGSMAVNNTEKEPGQNNTCTRIANDSSTNNNSKNSNDSNNRNKSTLSSEENNQKKINEKESKKVGAMGQTSESQNNQDHDHD